MGIFQIMKFMLLVNKPKNYTILNPVLAYISNPRPLVYVILDMDQMELLFAEPKKFAVNMLKIKFALNFIVEKDIHANADTIPQLFVVEEILVDICMLRVQNC